MIKNKIKQLMLNADKTQSDIAVCLGTSKQCINNKISRETFKIQDLIKIADCTSSTLAFVDNNNDVIVKFDANDLK